MKMNRLINILLLSLAIFPLTYANAQNYTTNGYNTGTFGSVSRMHFTEDDTRNFGSLGNKIEVTFDTDRVTGRNIDATVRIRDDRNRPIVQSFQNRRCQKVDVYTNGDLWLIIVFRYTDFRNSRNDTEVKVNGIDLLRRSKFVVGIASGRDGEDDLVKTVRRSPEGKLCWLYWKERRGSNSFRSRHFVYDFSIGFYPIQQATRTEFTGFSARVVKDSEGRPSVELLENNTRFKDKELPWFRIIQPNGGENLMSGTPTGNTYRIKWETQGWKASHRAIVQFTTNYVGASTEWEDRPGSVGTGGSRTVEHTWPLPMVSSTKCRVRIGFYDAGASIVDRPHRILYVSDISDGKFTITAPELDVTTPNGNEIWEIGSRQTIQWTTNDHSSNVNIKISRDGRGFSTIESGVENTGSYEWVVEGPPTTRARIQVMRQADRLTDESDDFFTIANTDLGTNVTVQPEDETTGSTPITLTFPEVTMSGVTSLATFSNGPPAPGGFHIVPTNAPVYYDISTTASFVPPVTIEINYDESQLGDVSEHDLKLFHEDNGDFVDITTALDTDQNTITGETDTFSNFVIAAPISFSLVDGPPTSDGGRSQGVSWGDFDDDSQLDLFVANAGPFSGESNFLYSNNGGGSFAKITSGDIVTETGVSVSASWGDFNNDRNLDLFVANNGGKNFLYQNNGDGSFTKNTSGAIVNDIASSTGASWADYNSDGHLDIFVANAFGEDNALYRNNGDGSFSKITTDHIVNDGTYSFGCAWGDYDHDGDSDLFVANPNNVNNFLYENKGDGTFSRVTFGSVTNDGGNSTGGSWGDYDNDQDLDLFVTNLGNQNNFLYQNNSDGTFTKITQGDIVNDGGISGSSSWGDFDNDGDLDLFVSNSSFQNNFLYSNDGDGTFTKVTDGMPVNDGTISFGCAWGDYDKDGDQDLAVATTGEFGGADNLLYSNGGNGNNWINIRCVGTMSNRSAVGARVKVTTAQALALSLTIPPPPVVSVTQIREISGQTGYRSQNSLNAEFGLGSATTVKTVSIEWPSGEVQVLNNLDVNQCITVFEPINQPTPVGADVEVDFGSGFVITFDNVDVSGETTLEISNSGPAPGSGLSLGDPPTFYDLETTADFAGEIQICIDYSAIAYENEAGLALFHFENGQWLDVTTSIDIDNNIICGSVESLSPFAILQLKSPNDYVLLLEKRISIGKKVFSQGDLHSNKTITFKPGASINHAGDVSAVGRITIGKKNTIVGDVISGKKVNNHGTVNGKVLENADLDKVRLPKVSFSAGGKDIMVDRSEVLSISPDSYGKVEVGKNGRLILTTGEYFLEILRLDEESSLSLDVTDGQVTVNVEDKLRFDKKMEFEITPSGDFGTNKVTINYEGNDRIRIGRRARVLATIVAPEARITLDRDARFKGSIIAREIEVNNRCILLHHSSARNLSKVATLVEEKEDKFILASVPKEFELQQNYPNPFNPETRIQFSLPKASNVQITIFNVRGQVVRQLINDKYTAGVHNITWDGKNETKEAVSSGIYLYRMQAGDFIQVRKMSLLR